MAMAKRTNTSKALQAFMAKEKKHNPQALLEWEMACNTNNKRGHVFDQSEINALYARDNWSDCEHGATKTCHVKCHNGRKFENIVVKRHQTGGYIDEHADNPDTPQTGNQLIDEIMFWQKYADDETVSDTFCPILKYFTSKSDKVSAISETMQRNVVIIAQKAVYVSNATNCCEEAERLNASHGFIGTDSQTRWYEMNDVSELFGWRDAMRWAGGNCGVIFDYAKNCYKAVFIDYGL